MSIDLMKVFIRCPNCGYYTFKYDYHENESSERYEYFNVLNMELYPYRCSECKVESSYNDLFVNGYCKVESIEEYKDVFRRGLEMYLNSECFFFSEWNPERSEQPALGRLCMMYPEDSELQIIAHDYKMVKVFGREYLEANKNALTGRPQKKELNINIDNKEEINMSIRFTGIDTPLGGISWEYTTSPKKRIEDLFCLLESKRLLSNPWHLEVVSQCVESALEIKNALVSITKDVKFPNKDCFVFSSMIDASNKFLDDLNKMQGFVPQLQIGDNLFDYTLKQYRDTIKNGIRYFETSYNLKFSKEL